MYHIKIGKELAGDLTPIYTASTEKEALTALESFEFKWNKQYPQITKSWYAHWDNLMIFLEYPEEIRKVIYTTNAVEAVNSQLRKVTKNKRVFQMIMLFLKHYIWQLNI